MRDKMAASCENKEQNNKINTRIVSTGLRRQHGSPHHKMMYRKTENSKVNGSQVTDKITQTVELERRYMAAGFHLLEI